MNDPGKVTWSLGVYFFFVGMLWWRRSNGGRDHEIHGAHKELFQFRALSESWIISIPTPETKFPFSILVG